MASSSSNIKPLSSTNKLWIPKLLADFQTLNMNSHPKVEPSVLKAVDQYTQMLRQCQRLEETLDKKSSQKKKNLNKKSKPVEEKFVSKIDSIKMVCDLANNREQLDEYSEEDRQKLLKMKKMIRFDWDNTLFKTKPLLYPEITIRNLYEFDEVHDVNAEEMFDTIKVVEDLEAVHDEVEKFSEVLTADSFAINTYSYIKLYMEYAGRFVYVADCVYYIYQKLSKAKNEKEKKEVQEKYGKFFEVLINKYGINPTLEKEFYEWKADVINTVTQQSELTKTESCFLSYNYSKIMLEQCYPSCDHLRVALRKFGYEFAEFNYLAKRAYGAMLVLKCVFLPDALNAEEQLIKQKFTNELTNVDWTNITNDLTSYREQYALLSSADSQSSNEDSIDEEVDDNLSTQEKEESIEKNYSENTEKDGYPPKNETKGSSEIDKVKMDAKIASRRACPIDLTPPSEKRLTFKDKLLKLESFNITIDDCNREIDRIYNDAAENEDSRQTLETFRKLFAINFTNTYKGTTTEIHEFHERAKVFSTDKINSMLVPYLENEKRISKLAEIPKWLHNIYQNAKSDVEKDECEAIAIPALPLIMSASVGVRPMLDENTKKLAAIVKEMSQKNGLEPYQRIQLGFYYLNDILTKKMYKNPGMLAPLKRLESEFVVSTRSASRLFSMLHHVRAIILVKDLLTEDQQAIHKLGECMNSEDFSLVNVMAYSLCLEHEKRISNRQSTSKDALRSVSKYDHH